MIPNREYYYIGDVNHKTSGIWEFMLKYGLLSASHFEIRFSEDHSFSEGREDFLQLPHVFAEPWSGMQGAIAIKGEMTSEARTLLLRIVDDKNFQLWDFVLTKNGNKLLSVSDYNDRIVTEHFGKEFFENLFFSLFEVIPETKIQPCGCEMSESLESLRKLVTQEIITVIERKIEEENSV